MNNQQLTSAINTLCVSGRHANLYRLLKHLPGSMKVLVSDIIAEQKRRKFLQLLKEGNNEQ